MKGIRRLRISAMIATMILCFVLSCTGCAGQEQNQNNATASSSAAPASNTAEVRAGQPIRLDVDGYLYYLDYTKDYYSGDAIKAMEDQGVFHPACSAFFTHNLEGEPLTCRNYDEPHHVSAEDRTMTGLDVVLHCKPQGKYESIAIADALYCQENDPRLARGCLDEEGFDLSLIDTIPYECLDGINEKGLFVGFLAVDIKEGDEPATDVAGPSVMLRYLLDNCATVDEAEAYVKTSDIPPSSWQGTHLFVTDAEGNHAVIESRNSKITVTQTDVVTNFYVGYDDIADSYRKGSLREEAVALLDEEGQSRYRYGYGHGYHRFAALASQLETHRDRDADTYRTRMTEQEALIMLQSVAQNEQTTAAGTSMTQTSSMYNNAHKTLTVWSFQNWGVSYTFDTAGNQL